jgi:hypothetical protein
MPTYDPDGPAWQKPSAEIQAGDVFVDVPLLDSKEMARRDPDDPEKRIYLPTRRGELSVLLKVFPAGWWFVPVLTREHFGDDALFENHYELCELGRRPGWFPLPPWEGYEDLRDGSLIMTLRPTLHRPEAFADTDDLRIASLTPEAYDGACQSFIDGFTASWD